MDNLKSDVGLHQQALMKAIEVENPIESIKTYLEIVSEIDTQLKDALLSIDKSFEKCWKYIQTKAKEHLKSKSGHIPPSVIFGWSIHYFTENDDQLEIKSEKKEVSINIRRSDESPIDRMNRIKTQLKSLK